MQQYGTATDSKKIAVWQKQHTIIPPAYVIMRKWMNISHVAPSQCSSKTNSLWEPTELHLWQHTVIYSGWLHRDMVKILSKYVKGLSNESTWNWEQTHDLCMTHDSWSQLLTHMLWSVWESFEASKREMRSLLIRSLWELWAIWSAVFTTQTALSHVSSFIIVKRWRWIVNVQRMLYGSSCI